MAENNNTAGAGSGTEGSGKTFTQDEVNAIVEGRLSRERQKYADYDTLKEKAGKYDQQLESGKSDLEKAVEKITSLQEQLNNLTRSNTLRDIREKVSKETKVPASLLTGEDEESCKKQAQAILEFAKPSNGGYPGTKPNGKSGSSERSSGDNNEDMREWARQIFKGE